VRIFSVVAAGSVVNAEFGCEGAVASTTLCHSSPAEPVTSVDVQPLANAGSGGVSSSKFSVKPHAAGGVQTSLVVQALPSSQGFVLFVWTHSPAGDVQVSVVQTLPSLQSFGVSGAGAGEALIVLGAKGSVVADRAIHVEAG